jgi:hypothetical protein
MSWLLRPRNPSQPVTGANTRIRMGVFGESNLAYAFADVDPTSSNGIYHYHEGAVFTPGAENFVFEPQFELPIQTVWGFGFIRNPNTFNPFQPPQVYANPQTMLQGIGGLMAGQMALQPLILNEGS